MNGFALRKRDNIVLLTRAANRDPDAFDGPETTIERQGRRARTSLTAATGWKYSLKAV